MVESMTVTVGLDVHARSIRLAAVRADELLEERTLAHDEEALERVLRRWPVVRCCYEAGPTGFGLYRFLLERGIYLAPSQNEAMFLSTAHGDEEIDRTIQAVADFDG